MVSVKSAKTAVWHETHREVVPHVRLSTHVEANWAEQDVIVGSHPPADLHVDGRVHAVFLTVTALVVVLVFWPSGETDDVATPHHLLFQRLTQGDVHKWPNTFKVLRFQGSVSSPERTSRRSTTAFTVAVDTVPISPGPAVGEVFT